MRCGKLAEQSIPSMVSDIANNTINNMLAFFRISAGESLTVFEMIDGVIDDFQNEAGVDTGVSENQEYDSANKLYNPVSSGTDANTKLMLYCNGADGSTTISDSSPAAHGNATVVGTAQLDTAQKKYGSASLQVDGNSDYINFADSNDWNILNPSTITNFTIDFWFRANSTVGSLASQYESDGNYWDIRFNSNILELCSESGSGIAVRFSDSTQVSTGAWHHLAAIRVGNAYGLYIDGAQRAYTSNASSYNFSGLLQFGRCLKSGYFNGWIDEMRIQHSNVFNANPNSGKTDTIIMPSEPQRLNMTLQSIANTAEATPSDCRIVVLEEDVDSITINTDLKAYVSRDGSTWTQITLAKDGDYSATIKIYTGEVSIAGQPSGVSMKWKLVTDNTKMLKIHANGLYWG